MLSSSTFLGANQGLSASLTGQTGLASDPSAYRTLAQSARSGDTAGLEAAARAFEALLVGQMLKQMRSASLGDGLFDSEQTGLYRDLYDQQIASLISEGEGLGLREALLSQMTSASSRGVTERDPEELIVPERNPWLRRLQRQEVDAARSDEPSVAAETKTEPVVTASSAQGAAASTSPIGSLGTTPRGDWPPSSPEEFVAYLKPYADQAAQTLGMDTSVLLAQSALETGWGRHVPRHADGSSSFNLFGIKADRSWKGEKVSVGTLEYRNGVARRERAKFRAYANPAESFVDYVAFLRRNPRYRDALTSTNGEDFIRGLQKAGYATDPSYAAKVLRIRDRMERLSSAETQVSANQADSKQQG